MTVEGMETRSAIESLRNSELFRTLSPEALSAIAAGGRRRSYPRGAVVFLQGDPGDGLYVVLSGRVKITVESSEGDEMLLATLSPPDTFGELALIDGQPRSATAEALEQTELLWIGRDAFRAAYEKLPQVAESLLLILGRLVRRVTGQAADLALIDLEGRVARLLIRLLDSAGGAAELDLGMTQSEVASMVGGSRQSVNQILHGLARNGYIQVQGRRLRILRADDLRDRAGL
jgi:CRP-like cAMP-binding protein